MNQSEAMHKITGARPKIRKSLNENKNEITNISNANTDNFKINDDMMLPLEQKKIITSEDGVLIERPVLHPYWVEEKVYIYYVPPPYSKNSEEIIVGATEAWLEQTEFYKEDLSWLLSLSHHKFWSQVIYDKSVSSCLESYLTEGSRWYDDVPNNEQCLEIINKIHQLVFLIYIRMSTYKESKTDFITPSFFGQIIYDNFLYDICKILDLCVLYESTSKSLLVKMVNNIFTCQPKYFNDLQDLVISLKCVMENIELKLGISTNPTPINKNSENNLDFYDLEAIVKYLLDTFGSLKAFFAVFPKACLTFHNQDFELRLSTFYERVIPTVIDHLSSFEFSNFSWRDELLRKIYTVRIFILVLFREILVNSTMSQTNECQNIDSEKRVEMFVNVMSNCVEDKVFISDYNATYDIDEDMNYFKNIGVDMTTLNFVKEAIGSATAEVQLTSIIEELDLEERTEPEGCEEPLANENADSSGMNGYYAGETESLSQVEIVSLISTVQDLLPDLGNGFVKKCLQYYNYSSEECINALLENNLPPCLDSLDRSLQILEEPLNDLDKDEEPKEKDDNSTKEKDSSSNILVNRSNIYNDDEFDVFRQPNKIDLSKIHKGKKTDHFEYKPDENLADKMKDIARQYESNLGYSIYEDEEKYQPLQDYEDEYDDTYDADETGRDIDNFSTDARNFNRMPMLRGKGALNPRGMNFMPDSSEEGSGDENEGEGETEDKVPNNTHKEQNEERNYANSNKRANASYRIGYKQKYEDNSHTEYKCTSQENFKSRSKYKENAQGSYRSKFNDNSQGRFNNRFQENSQGGYSNRFQENSQGGYSNRFQENSQGGYSNQLQENSHGGTMVFTNSKIKNRIQNPTENLSNRPNSSGKFIDCRYDENSGVQRRENYSEIPQDTKRRMRRKMMNDQNKTGATNDREENVDIVTPEEETASSASGVTSKWSKNSGKGWRRGSNENSNETSGYKGGKYKEDTHTGKSQDKNYKHKMIHKSDHRKNEARSKYRNNF